VPEDADLITPARPDYSTQLVSRQDSVAPPPAAIYLARLAPTGRRSQKRALDTIAEWLSNGQLDAGTFPWADLRYAHTQAVRALLAERYAPATVNRHLAALRGVLRECFYLGLMSADDLQRASNLGAVRASPLPHGRALAHAEIRRMFEICRSDRRPAGIRDTAIFTVLYTAGLRRSELVSLDLRDYDPEDGGLTIRQAKGRKDRRTYLPSAARPLLGAWIVVRGHQPGALFWRIRKGGVLVPGRLDESSVLWILERRAKAAGAAHFSPHDLRRTYISNLLDSGADIATVQRLVGHASVTTTQRYDRRGEEVKRQAAEQLNVPNLTGSQE
jgi:integrase